MRSGCIDVPFEDFVLHNFKFMYFRWSENVPCTVVFQEPDSNLKGEYHLKKKNVIPRVLSFFIALILCAGVVCPTIFAAEADDEVQAVIEQLEAIDSLQEMQDKRSETTFGNKHAAYRYDVHTTDEAIITAHEDARAEYEAYIAAMVAARKAAKDAYESLSSAEKEKIDEELVAKLYDELDTGFQVVTREVTPRDDEYCFESMYTGALVYEASNHITAGSEIPYIFILVDTSDGKTSWTSTEGAYTYGESNYIVSYCCDLDTMLKGGADYKRINLEDSNYYNKAAAEKIRGIVKNSYPFLTLEETKKKLKEKGLDHDFVDSLTRSDIIAATQMAIWAYANSDSDVIAENIVYGSSYDITKNLNYGNPLHNHTNELWGWWNAVKGGKSYDAKAEYRVNTLVYYLCNLEGETATGNHVAISDVAVTRVELTPRVDGETYMVGMYVHLNGGASSGDNLKISVTSYDEDGEVTGRTTENVTSETMYQMSVKAKYGDTIKVEVEGTQYLGKDVYFYEPEGGRDESQCLVGMSEGKTRVRAVETFKFKEDIDMGLRIYKTEAETKRPISDITFNVYEVDGDDELSEAPTDEEIEKYAKEENLAGSAKTDKTGYACIDLKKGTYLVVEEHNEDKILDPVRPFYVVLPMPTDEKDDDGNMIYLDIVSVYPKNELVPPPPPPPPPPPWEELQGRFTILKHDELNEKTVLEGAEFRVYRAATEDDENTKTIVSDGVKYAVVPAEDVDGKSVYLKTDEDGIAISPDLYCGVYFVEEVKAPDGYNMLDEAVSVYVYPNEMTNVETVKIPNRGGVILPETGGMGTTLLLSIGGGMVVAAGTLLTIILVKRKKNTVK